MARTYRKNTDRYFRKPKTQQERKQINAILEDSESHEYEISGLNHLHHRMANLPTSWDDISISAYYENDHHS